MTINAELTISKLSCWQGSIDVEPLEGGITNHNYLVHDTDADHKYVVRLGRDIPVHHISRHRELATALAAFQAGLSPKIVHAEEGILVMDYIPGRTLSPDDVRSPSQLAEIVRIIRRCHRNIPDKLRGSAPMFWVFHVVRDYASSLEAGNSSHLAKLPELLKVNSELEQIAAPFDIVFGHNDLLAGNFIHDGERLWLIDWVTEELWKRYLAMKTASLLRETMWSMISELHSTLDFDYASYTIENLSRFKGALDDLRSIA